MLAGLVEPLVLRAAEVIAHADPGDPEVQDLHENLASVAPRQVQIGRLACRGESRWPRAPSANRSRPAPRFAERPRGPTRCTTCWRSSPDKSSITMKGKRQAEVGPGIEHLNDVLGVDCARCSSFAFETVTRSRLVTTSPPAMTLTATLRCVPKFIALVDGPHPSLAERTIDPIFSVNDLADHELSVGRRTMQLSFRFEVGCCPLDGRVGVPSFEDRAMQMPLAPPSCPWRSSAQVSRRERKSSRVRPPA